MRLHQLKYPISFRRSFCSSPVYQQTKHRLSKTNRLSPLTRPAFDSNSPYFLSPLPPPPTLTQNNNELQQDQAPIYVPLNALDPQLIQKLRNYHFKPTQNHFSDLDASQVRRDGENQLYEIMDDWVRNELNVMGTIREETIQIFMKLLLHPSTLAPIGEKLGLQTEGRTEPVKASGQPPRRLKTSWSIEDEELVSLVYYMIGAMYRTISGIKDGLTMTKYRGWVVNTVQVGVTQEVLRTLLIKASQLSGQYMAGDRKGFARAEIRVAQLAIWGQRRDNKIRKLVPEQLIHRTRFRDRKSDVLKTRWVQEELKMIHWRRRLLNITAFQENEKEAERLRQLDHSIRLEQWKLEQSINKSSSRVSPPTSSSLLSRIFNFWPFNSSSSVAH